jgi:oligopeptide transport system ATP-binding protein
MENKTILEVKNLTKFYPIRAGLFLKHAGDVQALSDVSFRLRKGATLGIVGESGCGKSTLAKCIIRLFEATSGAVYLNGENYFKLKGEDLRKARKNIQMIFQDPFASLDPRMTVSRILREPLVVHQVGSSQEKDQKVRDLMKVVGLDPRYLDRYPHEFSGGQRQRISVARCLALNPKMIIADEPVSALDVSIQAQILNLLKELQKEFDLTYLFISHALSVIEYMCDEIAVMYLGNIVEMASRDALFSRPSHPYTRALIDAIPVVGEGKKDKRKILQGDVASPINPPAGCKFHTRCAYMTDKCKKEVPPLEPIAEDHQVSCWLTKGPRSV